MNPAHFEPSALAFLCPVRRRGSQTQCWALAQLQTITLGPSRILGSKVFSQKHIYALRCSSLLEARLYALEPSPNVLVWFLLPCAEKDDQRRRGRGEPVVKLVLG